MLIQLGYSCGKYGADDDFGSGTKIAVKAFQSDFGLDVDGIAGKNTLSLIENKILQIKNDDEPQARSSFVTVKTGSWNV